MEIFNFDTDKDKSTKHHFLLPDCHYMWLKSDLITIYTINPEQEKYQMLQEFYNACAKNTFELESPENVVPVEELESDPKIIIFDDIKLDKKNMDKIKEYFSTIVILNVLHRITRVISQNKNLRKHMTWLQVNRIHSLC